MSLHRFLKKSKLTIKQNPWFLFVLGIMLQCLPVGWQNFAGLVPACLWNLISCHFSWRVPPVGQHLPFQVSLLLLLLAWKLVLMLCSWLCFIHIFQASGRTPSLKETSCDVFSLYPTPLHPPPPPSSLQSKSNLHFPSRALPKSYNWCMCDYGSNVCLPRGLCNPKAEG